MITSKAYIQQLIDIYKELANTVFFDGTGEYVMVDGINGKDWRTKARLFLDGYQTIIDSDPEAARYHFSLQEKEIESQIGCRKTFRSRKNKDSGKKTLILDYDVIDEPFEMYFELSYAISTPVKVLRWMLEKTEDSSVDQDLPKTTKDIKEIGPIKFILNAKGTALDTRYKGDTLDLPPKVRQVFFCIMNRCYGDDSKTISVGELRESYGNKTDSIEYIRRMTSEINAKMRDVACKENGESRLIASSSKDKIAYFSINHKFFTDS